MSQWGLGGFLGNVWKFSFPNLQTYSPGKKEKKKVLIGVNQEETSGFFPKPENKIIIVLTVNDVWGNRKF